MKEEKFKGNAPAVCAFSLGSRPGLALFMYRLHTVCKASASFPAKSWLVAFCLAVIGVSNILMAPKRLDFVTPPSFVFTAQKIF